MIGIILSGSLDEGVLGLYAIKSLGGVAIVQDPKDAQYPEMPLNAMQYVNVDFCLSAKEIVPTLKEITIKMPYSKLKKDYEDYKNTEVELEIDEKIPNSSIEELSKIGTPSYFTCSDCHGTLWEINDKHILRFRCRVGHMYGAEDLAVSVSENVEMLCGRH